jgi:hypothetical protein
VNDEHRDGACLEDVVADAAEQQGAKLCLRDIAAVS